MSDKTSKKFLLVDSYVNHQRNFGLTLAAAIIAEVDQPFHQSMDAC